MLFDKSFIKGALAEAEILFDTFPAEFEVSVDSRALRAGEFFVALSGAKVDGHDYVVDAVRRGASGFMINRSRADVLQAFSQSDLKNKLVIIVGDTLQALGDLARAWRQQFAYPVVAITGSVGKTSTRELFCNIARAAGLKVVASRGNLNSVVGLPMSIFAMRPTHQIAVFELGIAKRGEMARLVDIARPTVACVTAVGHSHMEGLGSLQDIAAEKRAIFSLFTEHNIGVVNGDQPLLGNVSYNHPVIRFGTKTTNQIQARKIRMGNDTASFVLKMYNKKYPVTISAAHEGMVYNALAAAGLARHLGIADTKIVEGVQQPFAVAGRYEHLQLAVGKGVLINDCYNANPESVRAALVALETIKTQATKIAVLGDMLELGVDAPYWHRQVGRFLRKAPSVKEVVLVGSMIQHAIPMLPTDVAVKSFNTNAEATAYLQQRAQVDELVVLVKASNGMKFSEIVKSLTGEIPIAAAVRAEPTVSAASVTPAKRPTSVI